jgi:hypothetical protein
VNAPAVSFYRLLILASIFVGLVGSFLDLALPGLVPEPMFAAFEAQPPPSTTALTVVSVLVLITFGGGIAATIGLYFFQAWSRPLAIWMTALGLLFHPVLGVSLQSGWAQLMLDVSTLLWGAVIAMSYVSSLRERFVPPPSMPADA